MQSLYFIIILSIAWLALCIGMWRLHRSRTQYKIENNAKTLIVYASQTGNAQSIANRCAGALNSSGGLSENISKNVDGNSAPSVSVISLNTLTAEHILTLDKILFVVSTYGDGEAPDNGSLFKKLLTAKIINNKQLEHLSYSVIALGDSTYPEFCAFGYQVDQAMKKAGSMQLSDVIAVDNYDEQTTNLADITPNWLNISQTPSAQELSTLAVKSPQYWQLTKRELLNPNCNDEALLQLTFKSIGPTPVWQAGDLIDIQPKHPVDVVDKWLIENNISGDTLLTHEGYQQSLRAWLLERDLPEATSQKANHYKVTELLEKLPYLHKRSYSIASISEEGQLQLIVRLLEKPIKNEQNSKTFGLASGYLSHYCQVGNIIDGHIRDVSSHHDIDHSKPIILIGAGSGLAGLKAQISARFYLAKQQEKGGGHTIGASWLIFGERNRNPELPLNKQLAALEDSAQVSKLSYAFSQNSEYPKYVQNVLIDEQDKLKEYIDDGAYIYVCGSLVGMGEGVQRSLESILGSEKLEQLQQQQRYIRDVY